MTPSLKHQLIIAAVAGLVFFTRLGATQLWDEDEAFFAATAAEMHHRGEWIVPWYNGEVFAHKPPMMYWMMRIGIHMFGENEFGARFFSAVFGLATALLTYQVGRRLFDGPTAFWAGLAMSTCLMFAIVSRASTADSYLTFFVTLALWLYLRAAPYFCSRDADATNPLSSSSRFAGLLPAGRLQWLLVYAVMGLAVLVKGPIGVLLPGMTIGLFLLCRCSVDSIGVAAEPPQARWRAATRWWATHFHPRRVAEAVWAMKPFTAMAAVALVAGPWFVLVGMRTDGAFLSEFFGTHNFGRFLAPMENHRGPIVYYIPVALAGFFPWSIFVLPTIGHLIQRLRAGAAENPTWLFLACWTVAMVGFFSIASTKLPNYILPAYPAFALLTAGYLRSWLTSPVQHWRHWPTMAYGSLILVGVAISAAIIALTQIESGGRPLMVRLEVNEAVVSSVAGLWWLGIPFILCGSLALWVLWAQQVVRSLHVFACGCPVLVLSLLVVAAERINPHQTSRQVTDFVEAESPAAPMGEYSHSLPSLVFYACQPVSRLDTGDEVQAFFESHPQASLVTTDSGWARLSGEIEFESIVVHEVPRFPKSGSVMVIQCSHAAEPVVSQSGEASEQPRVR